MANHISDKSRRFSLLALDELSKIQKQYLSAPEVKSLNEEKISWLNERMRSFHESVVKTNYKKFSFLQESKAVRNTIAHSTGELSKEELEATWHKFFAFSNKAKFELQNNISKSYSENKEIRQFEKFGSQKLGDQLERMALTQSLADAMDSSVTKAEKYQFAATPSGSQVEKFLQTENQKQKDLLDYAKKNSKLNEQIQTEILKNLSTAYDETDITNPENPFYNENLFVKKVSKLEDEALLKNLSAYTEELFATDTGKNNSANLAFYKKEYEELQKKIKPVKKSDKETTKETENANPLISKKEYLNDLAIISRNLKIDLQKSLTERYTAWQLEEIDKKRREYLEELYKKLEQFKKLEELLSPFIKNFGRLWDLSTGCFNDYGFEILKDFADLLENDEALRELADLIGRQENEKERYEIELRDKIEIKTEYHPKNAYRGQISGLRLSGEITSALPSELALFQNSATKVYFSQKFAEKKLLSYAYINQEKSYREELKKEETKKAVKDTEQKGPVIICVDTSGSMSGTPERIAKTITFALAKKCLDEDRKCYLISFSSDIEVKNLSDFSGSNGIEELVKFLRMSFHGGTAIEPAVEKTLELMQTKEWKNADMLVVSDMVMDNLTEKHVAAIEAQREKKSKFYSLVVGSSGNQKVIECFDENWTYDSNARDAMHHLVRQIHKIGDKNAGEEE